MIDKHHGKRESARSVQCIAHVVQVLSNAAAAAEEAAAAAAYPSMAPSPVPPVAPVPVQQRPMWPPGHDVAETPQPAGVGPISPTTDVVAAPSQVVSPRPP